jgi:hypothetical protein
MRETVGADTPNIRAICAAVFRPEITASAISRCLAASSFLRRIPNIARPEARAEGDRLIVLRPLCAKIFRKLLIVISENPHDF